MAVHVVCMTELSSTCRSNRPRLDTCMLKHLSSAYTVNYDYSEQAWSLREVCMVLVLGSRVQQRNQSQL